MKRNRFVLDISFQSLPNFCTNSINFSFSSFVQRLGGGLGGIEKLACLMEPSLMFAETKNKDVSANFKEVALPRKFSRHNNCRHFLEHQRT
jgi:hypothetical protein